MATIKGERQEIKPGFYSITRPADSGKLIAFFNDTTDTQFNICYTFNEPQVKAIGRTAVGEDNKYAISVYPGETIEFLEGKWKGFKRSLSFGAPDKEWQAKQAAKRDSKIEDEIAALKALVKQHPKADGKYTAEYIADLCIQHNVKFVDLTFPPKQSSLAREWEPSIGDFSWVSPDQYCTPEQPPQIFVGEIEPNDIDQGALGDCYYLCALACIAEFPLLVRDCFSLEQHPELGIYRVLVCKNGWWQTVIVDDFFPAHNGKPCFARNREEPNELWVSLLEKAYAKLHGSYSAIKSGDAALAIADVLGAPYRKFKQMPEYNDKPQLFKLLKKADEEDDLMSINAPGGAGSDPLTPEKRAEMAKQYEQVGLALDHAFSLLRVKEAGGHKLCMIRNPWGDEKEWNGAWSDDSSLWTPELQKEVGFYKGEDGTFWMAWDDVVKYFDNGSVSHVLRDWPQLRVTANFDGICADLVILLHVTKKVQCHFGAHQRDNRGLPSGDKDRKYVGMLLTVLQENEAGTGSVKITESNNGSYSTTRDSYASFIELEPSAKPYAILVQPYEDCVKSFVISMISNDPTAFERIAFSTCTEKKKYLPPTKFKLSDWSQKAVANYQLRMARADGHGMLVHAATADMVDLKALGGDIKVKKPTAPINVISKGPGEKHADPMAPVPSSTPGAAKPGATPAVKPDPSNKPKKAPKVNTSSVKLQMILLQGRNLVAKDSNGLSDPYITVKLKNAQGVHLSNDQRKETRYIQETLSPVWCEVFSFNCNPQDVLCIKCWDKDMFGHDAMGIINLPVSEAIEGLTAGGSSKIEWYKLLPPPDDASGEIQIAFTWMI